MCLELLTTFYTEESATNMQKSKSKTKKDKCHFTCSSVLCISEIISRPGTKQDPRKLRALMPPTTKRIASIPLNNYLSV